MRLKWRGLYGYITRLMSEVFPLRQETQHILRDLSYFYIPEVESVNCGFKSVN